MNNPVRLLISALAVFFLSTNLFGTPPYGDPNQPYDRLPGTYETYHVKWAKPLARKLKLLFIVPFAKSREVVELAQRLDCEYTVIMNAGRSAWDQGASEGSNATPLKGVESEELLKRLSKERLALSKKYDAIIIGDVSWLVIPDNVKKLILEHVKRGSGLVYVSPSRAPLIDFGNNYNKKVLKKAEDKDPLYEKLFRTDKFPEVAKGITNSLPMDVLPFKILKKPSESNSLKDLRKVDFWFAKQTPLYLNATDYGKGRVIGLDYFNYKMCSKKNQTALTPAVPYLKIYYDYYYALLSKCVMWAAKEPEQLTSGISFKAPKTNLKHYMDEKLLPYVWDFKTPKTVIARKDLKQSEVKFKLSNKSGAEVKFRAEYNISNIKGKVIEKGNFAGTAGKTPLIKDLELPVLAQGDYLVNLRLLDSKGRVLDFASKSFRVQTPVQVSSIKLDKKSYKKNQTVKGKVSFSKKLKDNQKVVLSVYDTWNREVFKKDIQLSSSRKQANFQFKIDSPLSDIWDAYCSVEDDKGTVVSKEKIIYIPKDKYDDYLWMFIFCTTPGADWMGCIGGKRARQFGLNSVFSNLIYGMLDQFETNERYHYNNVAYAEHLGQAYLDFGKPYNKELKGSSLTEISEMLRYTADTGKLMNSKLFPYKCKSYGGWLWGADWLKSRINNNYIPAKKHYSPYYVLTGENYLSGDMSGEENSGFSPHTTKKFQSWCKKQYKNKLKALNAEWNTKFTSWDQVRGILMKDAVMNDQMPRWVDFRYFMRSEVWTQFFIDYTDMLRRFIPGAKTATNGHDHYDFTKFRKHMTSGKMYVGQEVNSEWRQAMPGEMRMSFSGDKSYLLAAQSMIRWTYDLQTPINNKRWPWKCLFLGYRGFDWEQSIRNSTNLGGTSCFTPDFSEPLPFFKNISKEVLFLQRGIAKLIFNSKPYRSKVAILWSPYNHYISRLLPYQKRAFSGTYLYNISVYGGAPDDCMTLLNSIRIRPTFVGPQDLKDLKKRGFKALMLPYSKGVSKSEVAAISAFVKNGGLVIADNTPGIYSEHGKLLKKKRLAKLFPVTKKVNVVKYGKGHAVYIPDAFNNYLTGMEKGDYKNADVVSELLKRYAKIVSPVNITGADNIPVRDTLMPVWNNGSSRFVGMLRSSLPAAKKPENVSVNFKRNSYVWDVINRKFLGKGKSIKTKLDLNPKLFALLRVKPEGLNVVPAASSFKQGTTAVFNCKVDFSSKSSADKIAKTEQVVHVEIFDSVGKELEYYRQNILFKGGEFTIKIPISYSEKPGAYTIKMENSITGHQAENTFKISVP